MNSTNKRHQSRENAVRILYQLDISQSSPEQAIASYWQSLSTGHQDQEFVRSLVCGIWEKKEEIDVVIEKNSQNWRISRIPSLDLSILRLGAFELLHCADVPFRVCIDEAIQLAKSYGSEDSARFINGVLDQIANAHRAHQTGTPSSEAPPQ